MDQQRYPWLSSNSISIVPPHCHYLSRALCLSTPSDAVVFVYTTEGCLATLNKYLAKPSLFGRHMKINKGMLVSTNPKPQMCLAPEARGCGLN